VLVNDPPGRLVTAPHDNEDLVGLCVLASERVQAARQAFRALVAGNYD
jgi:hypothetical protein